MNTTEHRYQINGRVIDIKSGGGIAGLRVEAWDKDLIFDDLVGSDKTDVEGRFRIEFTGAHFRECFLDREPDLYFKVFSGPELIKSTQDSVLWNVRASVIPVEIAVPWTGSTTEEGGIYKVTGTVTSPDRPGVGGLRVQIADKNVGEDVALAETVTDERGRYQTSFQAPSLHERGKKQPDLQARAYVGQSFLAASEIRYNAAPNETLNVKLPANSTELASEHETLTRAIAAHYKGPLSDLKESDDRQDITYLANKTGWDARAVALAALADQFSRLHAAEAEIASTFFYALFRAGLPANPDTLYQADPQTVESVWKQAIKQGVIPIAMEQKIGGAVEAFQRLGAQKLLTAPALTGPSSLKEMLVTSSLNDLQQKQFAELYAVHRTDPTEFWKNVADTLGENTANRLQVDGKLGFLTINNAPLIQQLHDKVGGGNGVSDPLEIAQAGYHRAAKWGELLNGGIEIPKEIPGDTAETKRANYAEYLAAQVRLSYPTAAVAEMVKSGAIPLTGAPQGVTDQVHAFLTENQGRFEIGMQPVQQYIARNNLDVADATLAQVKRLQRVYQITPGDEAMTGLMKRGIDAAYHVVRYEKEAFVQTFAQDLGGTASAAQTYDKSVQIHNAVLNIAVSYLTAKNGIGLGAEPLSAQQRTSDAAGQILRPSPKGPTGENASDVIAYPTLEGLFGEMDFCACDHCRSILSPAAYLVDLLHTIDKIPAEADKRNPQTVLLERRPDVAHLPLTCENTNTALPYIDVVNETLEYFIANDVQKLSLNGYLGHDTSDALSEDLLANPRFVMDSAYRTLQGELFPAPLPFHQPLENLRRYFDKFEVRLPLAMERLRKTDDLERGANSYGCRDILMEELGLSRAEHQILTDSVAVPLRRLYGFPNGTTEAAIVVALSNAKKFTRRAEITYEEIAADPQDSIR